MLRGEDREDVRASDYRAWVLLPFNEEQIGEYLQGVLGPERVEARWTCVPRSIICANSRNAHCLSLIAKHIGALEARQARGDVVRGVALYGLLVDEWLARDSGKRHLRPEDKQTLMEDIAADMWQDAAREWERRRVLAWIAPGWHATRYPDAVCQQRAGVAGGRLSHRHVCAGRIAVRRAFAFAYIAAGKMLARYLLRALLDNAESGICRCLRQRPWISGQLLATASVRQQEAAIRALEHLLGSYRPQATDMALRYWLLAIQHDVRTNAVVC